MDDVFKALADPTRRALLDALFESDGQPLGALAERFEMTRFGVAKHLRVLEEAGLVVSERRGREKLHFLNAVPIQRIHNRWVSKYAEPWAEALTGLKDRLEDRSMERVFEIYIATTPERLWEAITDSGQRERYAFGVGVTSEWRPGARLECRHTSGLLITDGEVLEVDPPRRLVHTYRATWADEVKELGYSRVTWEIEPVTPEFALGVGEPGHHEAELARAGDRPVRSCRLTVTHSDLPEDAPEQLYGGWPMVLSGLKTLLETGEKLETPGSLRYEGAAA
jgi:uncharacterized protein YndB with AHSA1/START domain